MKNSVVYSSDPANLDICQGNAGHLEWQGTVESSGAWVWVLSETTNSVVTTHSEGVEMSGNWDGNWTRSQTLESRCVSGV